jgi:hypothetical protein
MRTHGISLEEHVLVAAWKRRDAQRPVPGLPPEVAGAGKHCRSGTEQRDRRHAGNPSQMRDAGIRADQQAGVLQQDPQLGEVEPA